MITHVIYHIPGRKVGCTKDMDYRQSVYATKEKSVPEMVILEELHDKTDQEAGDREWWWADHFGYRRWHHYTDSIRLTRQGSRARGLRRMETMTAEERTEFAAMGGRIVGRLRAQTMSPEERSEWAKKGYQSGVGAAAPEQLSEWGKKGGSRGAFKQQTTCPHCGLVGHLAALKRWHFDHCPRRRVGFVRGN